MNRAHTIRLNVIVAFATLLALTQCTMPQAPAVNSENTNQGSGSEGADPNELCYQGKISTILNNNCIACHSAGGGSSGHDLSTYANVIEHKSESLSLINTALMPPAPLQFTSTQDRDDLVAWLSEQNPADACTGTNPNPSPTPMPSMTPGLALPRVDLELVSPVHAVVADANGDDEYSQTIPMGLTAENRYLSGVTVFAVDTDTNLVTNTLHHLLVLKMPTGGADAAKATGFSGLFSGLSGFAGFFSKLFQPETRVPLFSYMNLYGGFVMGASTFIPPSGYGVKIPGDSMLTLSVHLNLASHAGAPGSGPKNVAIHVQYMFASGIPKEAYYSLQVDPMWIVNPQTMLIPANTVISHSYTSDPFMWLPTSSSSVDLRQVLYHMHNRGTAGQISLVNGAASTSLNMDNSFSYANQYMHDLANVTMLTRGKDKINAQCTWTNDQAHQPFIYGTQAPVQDLTWGESTMDEMCMWLLMATEQ
ncbi:MAG: hypothetical protein HYR96_11610 [Deltaproteobacteria bacterium]|nr:hypothetical protein [Deltaproteobacteria bacterium]